jgi:hypothetical protein
MNAFALLVAIGCGKGTPYRCIPVTGKVTYEDGSLIPADMIRITFQSLAKPIDAKTLPKDGRANVDAKSGKFDFVTTFTNRDGIIQGEHKVVVLCIRKGLQTHNLIPADYSDSAKTPLRIQSSDSPIILKIPKPL